MKVKVKLYGTLSRRFSGYQHSQGIEVEVPDGATVKDLLIFLEIPESLGTVVIMQGRVRKPEDKVQCGVTANIMQLMGGG